MSKVLIIGAGGVGGVVVHKCAQLAEVFDEIVAIRSATKNVTLKVILETGELQNEQWNEDPDRL